MSGPLQREQQAVGEGKGSMAPGISGRQQFLTPPRTPPGCGVLLDVDETGTAGLPGTPPRLFQTAWRQLSAALLRRVMYRKNVSRTSLGVVNASAADAISSDTSEPSQVKQADVKKKRKNLPVPRYENRRTSCLSEERFDEKDGDREKLFSNGRPFAIKSFYDVRPELQSCAFQRALRHVCTLTGVLTAAAATAAATARGVGLDPYTWPVDQSEDEGDQTPMYAH
ncbi:hypothetical protein HPB51_005460 [Rhipicephalus microplus]|uniref:Uncharacterized protein n=1 Tax=Rhipicephalus microplus TaxID=6941 RepID=A0A9J6EXM7_RHIMP|nr:hypothetical protein HPB51_005460 [Rhipicephalus microplus]